MNYNSAVERFSPSNKGGRASNTEIHKGHCIRVGYKSAESPVLAVGIPVFNGARDLQRTMDSLERALQSLGKTCMVEIIFCDNDSTDKTEDIIRNFLTLTHSSCTYFRQYTNIGFDLNLDTIITVSSATYIWFLGCGDMVKCDSFSRLLSKLSDENEYTNVLVDFEVYEELSNKMTDEKMFSFDEDILLEGKNNFQYNKYGASLSSNVVNRIKWLNISKFNLVVNGWGHVERILSMISVNDDSQTLLLSGAYFTLYRERDGWWTKPDSYIFILRHITIIRHMAKLGFSSKVIAKLERKKKGASLIRAVVQSKTDGLQVDKKIILELVGMFKQDVFFWVMVLPILLLPKNLLFFPRLALWIIAVLQKLR